jgi:cation:H+ antiporter
MFIDLALVATGLLLLVWGAERFVHGAAGLARRLGVSTLVVGLTVVAVGTSAPELLVNLTAQYQGVPDMAIGNVLGSNIANIGLVLGVSALILPLSVHSQILRREYPLVLGVTVLLGAMIFDGRLDAFDGSFLLLGLVGYGIWTLRSADEVSDDPFLAETVAEVPEPLPVGPAVFWLVLGLVTLLLGSRALVDGAASLAAAFGVSDLVIGLTVVAFGTSLPELAAALAAVAKREDNLVVGNVVGSCLLNLLLVLGVPALVGGLPAAADTLWRDWPVLLGLTLVLGPVFFAGPRTPFGLARVGRVEAGVLLAVYAGYIGYLFTTGDLPRS